MSKPEVRKGTSEEKKRWDWFLLLGGLLPAVIVGMFIGVRYADVRNQRQVGVLLNDQAASDRINGKFVNEAGAQGGAMTLRGEVVDVSCYLWHLGMGEEHHKCAKSCVLAGEPVGLRTADGAVYLLMGSHDKRWAYKRVRELVSSQVEVSGSEYVRGGLRGMQVTKVKPI